jgi:predicted nucleic acid-binding protein
MKHFLLDTNIVIDFLTHRKPFSILASKLFDYAEKEKIKIYLTAVSYNNIYYVVRKLSSHKEAINILKQIKELTETIDTTEAVIKEALQSDFKDFEDAIQYYCAKSVKKLDAIVTRNVADFKSSKIPVLKPEEAIQLAEKK